MRIRKADIESNSQVLLESRGDTTLRKTLELVAEKLDIKGFVKGERYCLHHYDGDHDNNDLDNLILMPFRRHASFHRTLNTMGISKDSKEALEILKNKYKNDIIPVGKILSSMIYKNAKEEADEDDKEI